MSVNNRRFYGEKYVPYYQAAADRIEWSDEYNDWKYTDAFMRSVSSIVKSRGAYPVGTISVGGYRIISVSLNKKKHLLRLHRVVFFKINGSIPKLGIDHIDGDTLNNHISNLREACMSINARNRATSSNNTSGFTGVSWSVERRKWVASITNNDGVMVNKRFDKKEDAIAHRKMLVEELGGYTERHYK